jgi:hypothetical protein
MAKSPARIYQRDDLVLRADDFVLGAGEIVRYAPESGIDPEKIDHFWITIRAGAVGLVRVSISTRSLRHCADGFDPRMRLAILPGNWAELPVSGLSRVRGLNYAKLKSETPQVYQVIERPALEQLLSSKCRRAIFLEAWGTFYFRAGLGIHQVHSRRASCSVRTDYVGRDGAIRFFYREDSATEMLLFKYCGQA